LSLSRGCGILHSKISVTESSPAHRKLRSNFIMDGKKQTTLLL